MDHEVSVDEVAGPDVPAARNRQDDSTVVHPPAFAAPAHLGPPPEPAPFPVPEHHRTARLLRRVLDCDVAALITVHFGSASIVLMTWDDQEARARARVSSDVSVSVLAARLPRRPDVTVLPPGGLDVAPPGAPPLRCQLVVPLLLDRGRQSAWLIGRAAGFCSEEIQHAELLAPGLRLQVSRADEAGGAGAVLTARERDVLALVARGLTSRAVAHRLGISGRTVHKHLEHAYGKLGCCDRLSAVLRARAEGLIAT